MDFTFYVLPITHYASRFTHHVSFSGGDFMPLSDKEKQALKEKYKDQRRAMWAGKSTLRRSNKTPSEEPSEAQVEDVQFIGEEAETAPHRSEQASQIETAINTPAKEQSSRTDTASRTLPTNEPNSAPSTRTTAGSPGFQTLEDNVPTPDEVQRIKEKIREQREETWEGVASTRSHRRRKQRQTDADEHQLWDSSENERGPIVLTWKLALGVLGVIVVLIGLGLLLGYWFAS